MKRMRETWFFGLAAKVLSDLVCNRPVVICQSILYIPKECSLVDDSRKGFKNNYTLFWTGSEQSRISLGFVSVYVTCTCAILKNCRRKSFRGSKTWMALDQVVSWTSELWNALGQVANLRSHLVKWPCVTCISASLHLVKCTLDGTYPSNIPNCKMGIYWGKRK